MSLEVSDIKDKDFGTCYKSLILLFSPAYCEKTPKNKLVLIIFC